MVTSRKSPKENQLNKSSSLSQIIENRAFSDDNDTPNSLHKNTEFIVTNDTKTKDSDINNNSFKPSKIIPKIITSDADESKNNSQIKSDLNKEISFDFARSSTKFSLSLNDIENVHIREKGKSTKSRMKTIKRNLLKSFCFFNPFMTTSKIQRLISKNGTANINRVNIERSKFISDFFNTVVDFQWRFILVIFSLTFLVSWTFFTICWYLNSQFYYSYYKIECVSGLEHYLRFFDYFLFSIETQQTIGYGSRAVTSQCGFSSIILMCQCGCNIFLECFLGGVLFSKLSRPKKRTETLIFSELAVISPRDGIYCFMCRIGDLRKSHVISAHVRLYIIKTRFTQEGEVIPCDVQELSISNTKNCLLFMPIIVEHRIDKNSPLFKLVKTSNENKDELNGFISEDFEILVTLEGMVESTGASIQGRTSFLPHEIYWNKVFEPLIDESTDKSSRITVDFSKFNDIKSLQKKVNYLDLMQQERLLSSFTMNSTLANFDETSINNNVNKRR